jgi:hypothetical protein
MYIHCFIDLLWRQFLIYYLLTSYILSFFFGRQFLSDLIIANGGMVVDDLILPDNSETGNKSSLFMISNPQGFRRPRYLLALAQGLYGCVCGIVCAYM